MNKSLKAGYYHELRNAIDDLTNQIADLAIESPSPRFQGVSEITVIWVGISDGFASIEPYRAEIHDIINTLNMRLPYSIKCHFVDPSDDQSVLKTEELNLSTNQKYVWCRVGPMKTDTPELHTDSTSSGAGYRGTEGSLNKSYSVALKEIRIATTIAFDGCDQYSRLDTANIREDYEHRNTSVTIGGKGFSIHHSWGYVDRYDPQETKIIPFLMQLHVASIFTDLLVEDTKCALIGSDLSRKSVLSPRSCVVKR